MRRLALLFLLAACGGEQEVTLTEAMSESACGVKAECIGREVIGFVAERCDPIAAPCLESQGFECEAWEPDGCGFVVRRMNPGRGEPDLIVLTVWPESGTSRPRIEVSLGHTDIRSADDDDFI